MSHRFRTAVVAIIAAVLLGLLPAAAPSITAGASTASACNASFANVPEGQPVPTPVSLVHGFSSRASMWQEPQGSSMEDKLQAMSAVVVDSFDYSKHHFAWVTHPAIGQALAEHIMCLSNASRVAGGDGKVIVVGHSMGGLALRQAANLTVDGKKVADVIGLAITMGTPHNGTGTASSFGWVPWTLCRTVVSWGVNLAKCLRSSAIDAMKLGSPQLEALPFFPPQVPLLTLAGDVQLKSHFLGVGNAKEFGDWAVSVASATMGYTSYGRGDGKKVIACSIRNDRLCSHTSMPESPVFHKAVRDAINAYLAYAASQSTEEPTQEPEPDPTPDRIKPTPSPTSSDDGGAIVGAGG